MPLERKEVPWRPANATEAEDFEMVWCDGCVAADGCSIREAAELFELGDPQYPPEWVCEAADVEPPNYTARCTAYRPEAGKAA